MRSEAGQRKLLGKHVKYVHGYAVELLLTNLISYRYKAKGAYEGIVEYLDQCHKEQVEGGVEAPETNHPF